MPSIQSILMNSINNVKLNNYLAGLFKTTYSGYFADNVSFFATATPTTFGANPATSVQTTAISEIA